MIYLDYAATSGQKPETVYSAADDALRNASGNPGRSGHKISLKAGDIVAEARLLCSRFFHSENPESMIFCSNATDALNLAIQGSVSKGDISSHLPWSITLWPALWNISRMREWR